MTQLMYAAWNGHEACARLLLPASNTLAQNDNGLTASRWAKRLGHESVAQFIDAYALAQSERILIGGASDSGTPRRQAARRV